MSEIITTAVPIFANMAAQDPSCFPNHAPQSLSAFAFTSSLRFFHLIVSWVNKPAWSVQHYSQNITQTPSFARSRSSPILFCKVIMKVASNCSPKVASPSLV